MFKVSVSIEEVKVAVLVTGTMYRNEVVLQLNTCDAGPSTPAMWVCLTRTGQIVHSPCTIKTDGSCTRLFDGTPVSHRVYGEVEQKHYNDLARELLCQVLPAKVMLNADFQMAAFALWSVEASAHEMLD